MKNCLHCAKELKHVPGRKEKSFCDVNCRNKHFYAKRKELIKKGLSAEKEILKASPMTPEQSVALHNAENKDQFTQIHEIPLNKVKELYVDQTASYEALAKNEDIQKQIEAIKSEKCPKERDTPMGRKSWQLDQAKRIKELENQLK